METYRTWIGQDKSADGRTRYCSHCTASHCLSISRKKEMVKVFLNQDLQEGVHSPPREAWVLKLLKQSVQAAKTPTWIEAVTTSMLCKSA